MVEPIFPRDNVHLVQGQPGVYEQRSAGSGKLVQVHFCATCGTKLYLTFERFPTSCGVYAGTFDDPSWFAITPATARHIYIGVARPETMLPAGLACYGEHALDESGSLKEPIVLDEAQTAARVRAWGTTEPRGGSPDLCRSPEQDGGGGKDEEDDSR
jgi:hypothetical protein